MDVRYRDARVEECPRVAKYIRDASDGMLDFLFDGNAGGLSATEVLTFGLGDESRHDSYRSVAVAARGPDAADLVGVVQFYPAAFHRIDEEMRSFLPGEKLSLFEEFYRSGVEDSLLVNAMFVDASYRRRGIGTKLLSLAAERARSLGLGKLSLFVLAHNTGAQRVYRANGFRLAKEIRLPGDIGLGRGIHLMDCKI